MSDPGSNGPDQPDPQEGNRHGNYGGRDSFPAVCQDHGRGTHADPRIKQRAACTQSRRRHYNPYVWPSGHRFLHSRRKMSASIMPAVLASRSGLHAACQGLQILTTEFVFGQVRQRQRQSCRSTARRRILRARFCWWPATCTVLQQSSSLKHLQRLPTQLSSKRVPIWTPSISRARRTRTRKITASTP